ncbi:MAG: diguanylate cyclase, partial [Clostridia bacterium]|nr:diguanylate cyclase [Clostridia bacterium]
MPENNEYLYDIYMSIINNMQDGAYFVDKERKILFWNRAAEKITGYSADEIVGKDCPNSGLNHIDDEGRPLCTVGCPLFATNIDGKQRKERVFVRHKDGYRIPLQVNIFPIKKDNEIIGSIELFTQDSPTKYEDDLIERLSGIAMHDDLTGLPNRRYLESFLDYKLAQFERFGKNFAVMFADIDNFSQVNNTYGHDAGDMVLVNIAQSLKLNMRKDDLA